MICSYQRSNNCASMDNFRDLVQLYFAFASVFLSNALLWNFDQKYKYSLLRKFENVSKIIFQTTEAKWWRYVQRSESSFV